MRAVLEILQVAAVAVVTSVDEGPGHPECPTPVLAYTTGEEEDAHLFASSVEWVVVDLVFHRSAPGWVVLIELVSDGDAELESFEQHPEGLAQVYTSTGWVLQSDFEQLLCYTKHIG